MPTHDETLEFARGLLARLSEPTEDDIATTTEFLRLNAGEQSTFFKDSLGRSPYDTTAEWGASVRSYLSGWVTLAEAGFAGGGAPTAARHLAATDLMEQVEALLQDERVHPAAPVVLAASALEELLRSMLDAHEIEPRGRPGIDSYVKALRSAEVISAQDVKDVTSCAGLRNQAAHGQFDQVSIEGARIMAMSVNLFMQKHSP